MKKLSLLVLTLVLCLMTATALAADVPSSTSKLPDMPAMPESPQIVRVQKNGDTLTITLDRALPAESLVTMRGVGADGRKAEINAQPGEGNVYTAAGLPEGGQWLGVDIAWVDGDVNAVAHYNHAGGLDRVTRFDSHLNEYVYNSEGVFYEFANSVSDIRARFDSRGSLVSYGYVAMANTTVWFNLQGDILWADYDDGAFACTWVNGEGWYISTPTGRMTVTLNFTPWGASPLLPPEEEEEEPKVVWYPNNTIGLAGLSLQEASSSLPNKWYNVVPVNLTVEGRQTFFLVITNDKFVGECYVDVYGDEVTVSYSLVQNSSLEYVSHYGRWFTNLSQITTASIEANDDPIPFGEPLSISEDLGGADVALLFIRSKGTYRLPFADGTELTEYWRNKPNWKEFRRQLQELMPYVEN